MKLIRNTLVILAVLAATPDRACSQLLEGTTKTVLETADKKLTELVLKVASKKKKTAADTVAAAPVVSPAAPAAEAWDCEACGHKGNAGNFCTECGTKKPEPIVPWVCTKCGKKDNTGNFCMECGEKKPEPIVPWTCPKCDKKGNTGKFCVNCGTKKPEEWKCTACGTANTGNVCDNCGEKKPVAPTAASDQYLIYAKALAPESAENWTLKLSLYDDSTPSSTLDFLTFRDAVNGMMELPSAKWMITPDSITIWKMRQQNVEAATAIMTDRYSNMIIKLSSQADSLKKALESVTPEQPKLAIDSTDRAEALKQAGFQPDEKSEGRIEGALIPYLSKKWGMEQSAVKKILTIAKADENLAVKYVSEKFPDQLYTATTTKKPGEDKKALYAAVADTLSRINSEIESPHAVTLQEDLKVLAEKISSGWLKSDACNDVMELEKTIDEMMAEWKKFNKKGGETPTFWKDGRAAENTAVDTWNMEMAIEWRKAVQKHMEMEKAYGRKIAELETRLETIKGMEDPTVEYLEAKVRCCSMMAVIARFMTTPAAVLCIPTAKHVDETKYDK